MKLIVPKTIGFDDFEINLNASTDTEYDYTGATTYTTETVLVSYESDGTTEILPAKTFTAVSSTTGYPPTSDDWIDNGAVNQHKMFDSYINTQAVADGTESTDAGKIVFTIDSSKANSIALFSVVGTSVKYELKRIIDSVETVVQTIEDASIGNRFTSGLYGYFMGDFPETNDLIQYFDIYLVSTITVTIEHTGSVTGTAYPKCGFVSIGQSVYCGKTQWGAEPGFLDFSTIVRNETTGDIYTNKGNYVKILNFTVRIEKDQIDTIQNAAVNVRGTPTVFDANNTGTNFEVLRVLGLLMYFKPGLESYGETECQFKIEGII